MTNRKYTCHFSVSCVSPKENMFDVSDFKKLHNRQNNVYYFLFSDLDPTLAVHPPPNGSTVNFKLMS